tara:strand:+ start:207 stop:758 length:552 start_codon:yes stop_codon:yes gene_type:complete
MKKIILIIVLCISANVQSQFNYEYGVIHLRDGSKLKGWVKKINLKELKYKETESAKVIKYNYKKVDKIVINDVLYQFKIVKGNRKNYPRLLELMKSGKVSLYVLRVQPTHYTVGGIEYYLSRNDSHLVESIGQRTLAIGRKNVIKGLKNYFKDCPNLIKKIKNKEFGKKDVKKVVEYYNNNCD